MNSTFQNAGQVLSIGIFFTLMIIGLSATLPSALLHGLTAHGVSAHDAARVSKLPPVSVLFAALLGYSPIQHLLGPHVLNHLPAASRHLLVGRSFFPNLIINPFRSGLHEAFDFAVIASLVAAVCSYLRGGRYVYKDPEPKGTPPAPAPVGAGEPVLAMAGGLSGNGAPHTESARSGP
jgi:hypothetical protein